MAVISLLTDFGTRDGFVGIMKGVIWDINPQVQVADISHEVNPQNILHGALILGQSWKYFPNGSVHLVVVDPGVGTQRRAIAAKIGKHFFVCPDNGLITIPLEQAISSGDPVRAVLLDRSEFWLPRISRSFHGRDIFAPTAAHLATGVPIEQLGSPLDSIVKILIPQPLPTADGWRAQVMMVDHFGNLISNLSEERLENQAVLAVTCGGMTIRHFVSTFGDAKPGELIAMIDSSGWLSVSLVNGNAAKVLHVQEGDLVEVVINRVQIP